MSPRRRGFLAVCAALPLTGLLATVFYAAGSDNTAQVLASAVMLALASTVVGGLVGFLFGVPRSAAGNDDSRVTATSHSRYLANTNLEQISDWLTKILVGLGLTQLGPIHDALKRLISSVEPALGARPDSGVFGAALLVCYTVSGFMCGWLATRLLVTSALSDVDCAMEQLHRSADELQAGNTERSLELQADGLRILGETRRYELLRQLLPSGDLRSTEIKSILTQARQEARDAQWTARQAQELFDTGTDGNRIYSLALMSESPVLADVDRILSAIEIPRSRSEQITALRAAHTVKPKLDQSQVQRLKEAIEEQLNRGAIPADSQRATVAHQFLADPI